MAKPVFQCQPVPLCGLGTGLLPRPILCPAAVGLRLPDSPAPRTAVPRQDTGPALPAGQGLACPGADGRRTEQKKPRQWRPGTLPHAAPRPGANATRSRKPIFPMATAAPPPWVKESLAHTAAPAPAPRSRAPELRRPRRLAGSQVSPARLRPPSQRVALETHLPTQGRRKRWPPPRRLRHGICV